MQTLGDPNFYAVQSEGRKVCEELGDRQCVSYAWRIHGNYLYYKGLFGEAQQAYQEGIKAARELGDGAELANLATGLGVVAESNLEWGKAEQNFLEAVSLKNETGYAPGEDQLQLADLYLRTGRLSDAARVADAAFSEARKTNAREQSGEVFLLRATLARLAGRLDTAQEMAEKAVTELHASNSNALLELAAASVSSILTARGDLGNAEKRLAGPSIDDFPEDQGSIELARAELLLAQGVFQQAADQAQRAAADFATAHLDEKSAAALVTKADALEMLGRNSDALQASEEAEKRAARIPYPLAVTSARLAVWRLSGASDSQVPANLHATVVSLKNPELALAEDFDRAVRARRVGSPNARRLFETLTNKAASQGYLTLSRRARSLEQ